MGSNLIIEVNQQTEEILICDLSICEVLNKIPDNGGVIRERLKSISSYEIKNNIWINVILNLFILIVLNLKYLNFRKF